MSTRLTEMQADVLFQVDEQWLRPMDMGGRDGSNHSGILAALVRKGFVERKERGGLNLARGSYVYRITPEGIAARGAWRLESQDSETNR